MTIHIANLVITGQRLRFGGVTVFEARTQSGQLAIVLRANRFATSWATLFEKLSRAGVPVALIKDAKGQVLVEFKQLQSFEEASACVAAALLGSQPRAERFFVDKGFIGVAQSLDVRSQSDDAKLPQPRLMSRKLVTAATCALAAAVVVAIALTTNTSHQPQLLAKARHERVADVDQVEVTATPTFANLSLESVGRLLRLGAGNMSHQQFDQDLLFDGLVAEGVELEVTKVVELGGVTQIDFVVGRKIKVQARFEVRDGAWALSSLERG